MQFALDLLEYNDNVIIVYIIHRWYHRSREVFQDNRPADLEESETPVSYNPEESFKSAIARVPPSRMMVPRTVMDRQTASFAGSSVCLRFRLNITAVHPPSSFEQ